jgi:hypothetical protein
MQPQDRFRILAPQVIGEVIDGEAIVVNLETGAYYSLQGIGSVIWSLVEAGATRAAITAAIAGRFAGEEGEIAVAVDRLLDELLEEGLIALRTDVPGATAELSDETLSPSARAPFVPPTLAKYTDMADLLLLDPIHDVGQTGWPQPAERG